MSTFKQDHDELQARLENQQQETREARAYFKFLESHRGEIIPCEANWQAITFYFRGDEITLENLQEAWENPAFRNTLALQTPPTPADGRENLLAEYQNAIKGWSSEAIKGELSKARYWPADQIKQKLTEVQTRKALQEKTVPELRLIASARPAQEQAELPAHMDRAYLLSLSAPGAFKKVVERYGSKAVTERLNQR